MINQQFILPLKKNASGERQEEKYREENIGEKNPLLLCAFARKFLSQRRKEAKDFLQQSIIYFIYVITKLKDEKILRFVQKKSFQMQHIFSYCV